MGDFSDIVDLLGNYTQDQIEKALFYATFENDELYRYYDNLRYIPKTDMDPLVQQTLAELKIVFRSRGLPMPEWKPARRRSRLWRRVVRWF